MGLLDVFRAKWKHPDAAVRRGAVDALDDPALLARIARSDPDGGVRNAAVERLSDRPVLLAIALEDSEASVREVAAAKLQAGAAEEPTILSRLAVESPDASVRASIVASLDDEAVLAERAANDADASVREAASRNLHARMVRFVEGDRADDLRRVFRAWGEPRPPKGEDTLAHLAARADARRCLEAIGAAAPVLFGELNGEGRLPAHVAAASGHAGCLEIIGRAAPATMSIADKAGKAPVDLAIEAGHEPCLRYLLTVSAVRDATHNAQGTPRALGVVLSGNAEMVAVVAELVPEWCLTETSGGVSIAFAAAQEGAVPVLEAVGRRDPAALGRPQAAVSGISPAWQAADNGQVDALRAIASFNAEALRVANDEGITPLAAAAGEGHSEALQFLSEMAPEDLETADAKGRTPAVHAALGGHRACLDVIFQHAPAQATWRGEGVTPTLSHIAAYQGHANLLAFLLERDPEAATVGGPNDTLAMHAVLGGSTACFERIVSHAPEQLRIPTAAGASVAGRAASSGLADILRIIGRTDPGALAMKDRIDSVPARDAAAKGHTSCVEAIAEFAIETLAMPAKDGTTALAVAGYGGHTETFEALLRLSPPSRSAIPGVEKYVRGKPALQRLLADSQRPVAPTRHWVAVAGERTPTGVSCNGCGGEHGALLSWKCTKCKSYFCARCTSQHSLSHTAECPICSGRQTRVDSVRDRVAAMPMIKITLD